MMTEKDILFDSGVPIGYISLDVLAGTLSLPKPYLKKLADDGKIPFLNVSGRRRFNTKSVRAALQKLEKGGSDAD